MKFQIAQIAAILNGELHGNGESFVDNVQPIESARTGSITFLSNPKYEPFLYTTQASAVIVNKSLQLNGDVSPTLIRVDDAYSSFTLLLEEYERAISFQKMGLDAHSSIHESASLGKNVYVGPFAVIEENVKIADNVKIFPNSYIGANSVIGKNTIIRSGVNIYSGTEIGDFCTIHSGAVLGSDGFGYAPQPDGSYKKIPQLGKVILEDHVDIGANAVVDCATFDCTIIKRGVKLDNLVQIAHNVEVGEHTVIAAQAGVAGSTKIGKHCVIGGQAGIVGHLNIADQTKIQAQSGVNRNTKNGQAIYGSPAIDYNNYLRAFSIFKKLPEVMKQIEALEEKILNLPPD